jgi:alanine racemase
MAVVKADAYGHGAVECSHRLEREGVDWFGVALPEEGVELREAGISKPILCLGGFWEGQERVLLESNLTPVIYRFDHAERLQAAALERDVKFPVHVKIDTGMGRLGIRFDEVREFASRLKEFASIKLEGLMTHFAAADDFDESDFTADQIRRFDETVAIFRAQGFAPKYFDLANSPATLVHANSRGNMVRIGGLLYGLSWDVLPKDFEAPELQQVMTLHSQISQLKRISKGETVGYGRTFKAERDSHIGLVPIGYQDGYPRLLSNRGRVIVEGASAPVIGRISMDWTTVDVTDISKVREGSEVTLIGSDGNVQITAEELAKSSETISYEVTCGISRRVRRVYRDKS